MSWKLIINRLEQRSDDWRVETENPSSEAWRENWILIEFSNIMHESFTSSAQILIVNRIDSTTQQVALNFMQILNLLIRSLFIKVFVILHRLWIFMKIWQGDLKKPILIEVNRFVSIFQEDSNPPTFQAKRLINFLIGFIKISWQTFFDV